MISVNTCPLTIRSFLHSYIHQFIHFVVSLTRRSWPLPNLVLHTVRYSASSLNFQYPLVSLKLSSRCLLLLLRLSANDILSSIFPSITCFKRHFYANCDQCGQPSLFLLCIGYYYYYYYCCCCCYYVQAMKIYNI
jgi:hypothetical protein